MGESFVASNKPLLVFIGTDPENSEEDYLNAAPANVLFNISPEPVNTPLHQNCLHRSTTIIQTTLDDASQVSVLAIYIKSDWKFLREFYKMFDSERNK